MGVFEVVLGKENALSCEWVLWLWIKYITILSGCTLLCKRRLTIAMQQSLWLFTLPFTELWVNTNGRHSEHMCLGKNSTRSELHNLK